MSILSNIIGSFAKFKKVSVGANTVITDGSILADNLVITADEIDLTGTGNGQITVSDDVVINADTTNSITLGLQTAAMNSSNPGDDAVATKKFVLDNAVSEAVVTSEGGNTRAITTADNGKVIKFNGASGQPVDITFPAGLGTDFQMIIYQGIGEALRFKAATSSAFINALPSGQYNDSATTFATTEGSFSRVVVKADTTGNAYLLSGDLTTVTP